MGNAPKAADEARRRFLTALADLERAHGIQLALLAASEAQAALAVLAMIRE